MAYFPDHSVCQAMMEELYCQLVSIRRLLTLANRLHVSQLFSFGLNAYMAKRYVQHMNWKSLHSRFTFISAIWILLIWPTLIHILAIFSNIHSFKHYRPRSYYLKVRISSLVVSLVSSLPFSYLQSLSRVYLDNSLLTYLFTWVTLKIMRGGQGGEVLAFDFKKPLKTK